MIKCLINRGHIVENVIDEMVCDVTEIFEHLFNATKSNFEIFIDMIIPILYGVNQLSEINDEKDKLEFGEYYSHIGVIIDKAQLSLNKLKNISLEFFDNESEFIKHVLELFESVSDSLSEFMGGVTIGIELYNSVLGYEIDNDINNNTDDDDKNRFLNLISKCKKLKDLISSYLITVNVYIITLRAYHGDIDDFIN